MAVHEVVYTERMKLKELEALPHYSGIGLENKLKRLLHFDALLDWYHGRRSTRPEVFRL